jgi:hypothetical protein
MKSFVVRRRLLPLFLVAACLVVASACSKTPENANAATPEGSAASADASSPDGLPLDGSADRHRSAETEQITVPAGTPINVRLQSSVSSAYSQSGQSFDAVLAAPIIVGGRALAKSGADVTGRVTAAHRSGHLQDPGYISLTLTSIKINGREESVRTSSVSAKGSSHKKRNLALIGGGSGLGALVGGLAGGGKGALIGAGAGAAAGTTGAYATGKKDVGFSSERRLTFRLTQPIHVR